MSDELALHRDVDRAAKATALLTDPLFVSTTDQLEAEYIEAWRQSEPRDTQGRELSWLALKALDRMRARFTSIVNDGKMAQNEIDRDNAKRAAAAAKQAKR